VTRTIVVTFPVPCYELSELELTSEDNTVVVAGPEGFSHELKLPAEADMERLEVELFHGYLELRAPRVAT
jgi:HSP20 family molecular chaperone IbpA